MNVKPLVWNEKLIVKFWDYYSKFPEKYFTYQFGGNIVNEFQQYINPGMKVLDFGCGTGFLIEHLLNRGFDTYGTDTSTESLKYVENKYRDRPTFRGVFHVDELTKSGQKFDAIFVLEVIEHLPDEFLLPLLDNVKKLLAKDGKVFVTTPNAEDLSASEVYCPVCDHTFHRWQHVRSWTKESVTESFASRGLRVTNAYGVDFSISPPQETLQKAKQSVRDFFFPPGKPHLVAVCEHAQ